jgi:hypothetical protein
MSFSSRFKGPAIALLKKAPLLIVDLESYGGNPTQSIVD